MDNMQNNSAKFQADFDTTWNGLGSRIRDNMVEQFYGEEGHATELEIISVLLIETLDNYALDEGSEGKDATQGQFTIAQKARLLEIADNIGPDWAQALYHTAIFITKVA